MGLYKSEIIVWEFLRYFHFWLWRYPLKLDDSFKRFYLTEFSFRNWAPAVLGGVWCFVFGQISLLTAVYFKMKNSAELIDSLLLLLLWYCPSCIAITMLAVVSDVHLELGAVNRGLEMVEQLCEGKIMKKPEKLFFFKLIFF